MTTTVLKREAFMNYWSQYSDKCDVNSMMLNNNSDELDSLDRLEILSSLPNLQGKDVLEVGCGIGRFSAALADNARHLIATDFIESFLETNKHINVSRDNIKFQLCDAANLKIEPNSVDLVFTNWLLMYLNDSETIEFLCNAIQWLRPDGHIHIRESCSEPSSGKSKGSMHSSSEKNPTRYRFSSVYIKLIESITYRDSSNILWKYEIQWVCSVSTYIIKHNNWRQVHFLAKKVRADESDEANIEEILDKFTTIWNLKQKKLDSIMEIEDYCWTNRLLSAHKSAQIHDGHLTIASYNPRHSDVHLDANFIAQNFGCNIWNIEINPFYYRTSLTKANRLKDHRVRHGFYANFEKATDYWIERSASFDAFFATEFLSTVEPSVIKKLPLILRDGALLVLLEPCDGNRMTNGFVNETLNCLESVRVDDVTELCNKSIADYSKKASNKKVIQWLLITAKARKP